jgi:hypothetical protein
MLRKRPPALGRNAKSDAPAKRQFVEFLLGQGYTKAWVARLPDVIAERNGRTEYFEIKYTTKSSADAYWGAATLSEWELAAEFPDRFWFVVARESAEGWVFQLFTPDEFLLYSWIPPFKVYFTIPANLSERTRKKVGCNRAVISLLSKQYKEIRALLDGAVDTAC